MARKCPEREADIAFMQKPELWPDAPYLFVKRYHARPKMGVIWAGSTEPGIVIHLFSYADWDLVPHKLTYADAESVFADGWALHL